MGNISREKPIFPANVLKFARNTKKIALDRTNDCVLTGVSVPVFNIRRFRLAFSIHVSRRKI